MQYVINGYLCPGFSVDDPPHVMDPNLVNVAKYLSVYLGNDADFYKFGAQLVSNKKVDVQIIRKDTTKSLPKKCLALIELWITSVTGSKWQDVIEAASVSGFGGLATTLKAEFGSQKEQQKEKRVVSGDNYKGIITINYCVLTIYPGVVTFIRPVEPYAFATRIKIFDSCLIA